MKFAYVLFAILFAFFISLSAASQGNDSGTQEIQMVIEDPVLDLVIESINQGAIDYFVINTLAGPAIELRSNVLRCVYIESLSYTGLESESETFGRVNSDKNNYIYFDANYI